MKIWRMGSCCWPCWRSFLDKNWWVSPVIRLAFELFTKHQVFQIFWYFWIDIISNLKYQEWGWGGGWKKSNWFLPLGCFGQTPLKLQSWCSECARTRNCWCAFIRMVILNRKARINKDRSHASHNQTRPTQAQTLLDDFTCQYCLRSKPSVSYWSGYL